MSNAGLHDISGMGAIPIFKSFDTGTAKKVKLPYFIRSKDALVSHS
jgi:hypothetical protein